MILELEIFVFGASIIAYIIRIEKVLMRLATIIELCPNCPHAQKIED